MSSTHTAPSTTFRWIASLVLMLAAAGLAYWLISVKAAARAQAQEAAAQQPQPQAVVAAAPARTSSYVRTTTAIGTVRAVRTVQLRSELPGLVSEVNLPSGAIVEAGSLLVALDTAVETAELNAAQARVRLADTLLQRVERAAQSQGAAEADVDRARSELEVARADVVRLEALISRKRIFAPFRARIGLNDLQVGQYLDAGAQLALLQGVDDAVHVDFRVAQEVAARLAVGDELEVFTADGKSHKAVIVAQEAEIDVRTRSATFRASLQGAEVPTPGGSVRVRVAVADPQSVTLVSVAALRRGPGGDHVFVVAKSADGALRAQQRSVTSGPMLGDEVVLLEGVAEGELVAASGSFKLFDGMLVALAPEQPAAAPAGTR
jgi:membrane fusion protein (multidrug efflux system)